MPQYIRVEVFPSRVDINSGETVFDPARTIVTDDAVIVYVDSPSGPTEAYNERIDDFSGSAQEGYTVVTDSGDVVFIIKTTGCGCGSRLRSFHPFVGVQRLPM